MKTNRTHNSTYIGLSISFMLLFLSLLLTKIIKLDGVLIACLLLLTLVLIMIVLIIHMARTGRVKAKGAKRRRKKLLPIFYKKKSQPVFSTFSSAKK